MNKTSLLLSVLLFSGLILYSQSIELTIKNIKTQEGQLCVAIFDSEEGFKNEIPFWADFYPKTFNADEFVVHIQLPPGEYGVTVLDDENKDLKMNYTKIGFPKEGFGFANYKFKGFFKPSYNKFKFSLSEKEKLNLEVELKYYL